MGERWTLRLLLAVVLVLAVQLKLRHSLASPRFHPADDTGYFRAESAFQYRYAKMLALGQELPEVDLDAQFPEGVRVAQELTLGMERATAATFRLLPTRPEAFHIFVLLWVALVSSLSIWALYLCGLRLGRAPPLAFAAAAAYGLSWASLSHLIGSYGFQAFALPLIHLSLAAWWGALDPKEPRRPAHAWACGALLAAALASRHFSRFYLASFILACAWAAWRRRKDPLEGALLREALGPVLACAAAAAVLVSCLRESGLLLSPTLILGAGLYAALRWPNRAPLTLFGTLGGLALSLKLGPDAGSYAHVYGLLFEKLRHGLIKPADPSVLGQDARLLWTGPFNSPDLGLALFSLLPLALVLLPRAAAWRAAESDEASVSRDTCDALTVLYAAGTLLVARLLPFFAFFLCLSAMIGLKTRKRLAFWVFLAIAALEGAKSWSPGARWNVFMRLSAPFSSSVEQPTALFGSERTVIEWLRRYGAGAPVLSNYGVSASLLAYAQTPVLLQPKFESAAIRAKTAAFLKALYGDEESLFRFCSEHGARLFVYTTDDILDLSSDGPRYASGSLRLSSESPALLFHFRPEALRHFRLLYENRDFRVFGVGSSGLAAPKHDPVYDLAQYKPNTAPDGSMNLDVAGVARRIQSARNFVLVARLLAQRGLPEKAMGVYEASFETWPDERVRDEARRLEARP